MTQYYTDQDRIDAQTMRIDVSSETHADPCVTSARAAV